MPYMYAMRLICVVIALAMAATPALSEPKCFKRFNHSGDGVIQLLGRKNGKVFKGRYRDNCGRYTDDAYVAISQVFGAPNPPHRKVLSLRLIEFLDLLEDRLGPGAVITVTSGYRPPKYNARLRKGGALAAKASLHQYGMAADIIMEGVPSKLVWDHVRSMGFGGAGYYHGETVHVDVGPARSWDENSSGVGSGISDENKLIGLVTDYDKYAPGEVIVLTFIRMTAFPIKVDPQFTVISGQVDKDPRVLLTFRPRMGDLADQNTCRQFNGIEQMASIQWRLPSDMPPGRYSIRAGFCGSDHARMPKEVSTPQFEVRLP